MNQWKKSERQRWREFLRKARQDAGLNRNRLALASDIDPSYITLMEREGYIPRRNVAERLALALNRSVDETLLMAGYAPELLRDNPDLLPEVLATEVLPLSPRLLHWLQDLSPEKQRAASRMLQTLTKVVRDERDLAPAGAP